MLVEMALPNCGLNVQLKPSLLEYGGNSVSPDPVLKLKEPPKNVEPLIICACDVRERPMKAMVKK